MNKAIKGNQQEVIYTKTLNNKKELWDSLPYDKINTFAIHITTKKFGKINEGKINSKADIYFATGSVDLDYLNQNDFYLDEKDCETSNLIPIKNSGLSIKLSKSRYTITKISANTFFKIFGNNILGAGSSIYCRKESEFIKNKSVLKGWGINETDFKLYFSKALNIDDLDISDKNTLEKIKTFSNKKIKKDILMSKKISELIFKGIGNFEEPFTAHWLIENDLLIPNYYVPFIITTGSGRSKGIFTIVLKPK